MFMWEHTSGEAPPIILVTWPNSARQAQLDWEDAAVDLTIRHTEHTHKRQTVTHTPLLKCICYSGFELTYGKRSCGPSTEIFKKKFQFFHSYKRWNSLKQRSLALDSTTTISSLRVYELMSIWHVRQVQMWAYMWKYFLAVCNLTVTTGQEVTGKKFLHI